MWCNNLQPSRRIDRASKRLVFAKASGRSGDRVFRRRRHLADRVSRDGKPTPELCRKSKSNATAASATSLMSSRWRIECLLRSVVRRADWMGRKRQIVCSCTLLPLAPPQPRLPGIRLRRGFESIRGRFRHPKRRSHPWKRHLPLLRPPAESQWLLPAPGPPAPRRVRGSPWAFWAHCSERVLAQG